MEKSSFTIFLDLFRNALILVVTGYLLILIVELVLVGSFNCCYSSLYYRNECNRIHYASVICFNA